MKSVPPSRSGSPGRYPLATIAAYGPDSTLATKLVVSVLKRPGQRVSSAVRTWMTQAVDVRHDPTIAADVASFVQQQRAKETVTYDRIIGCPHEEGIDYPMGRVCPSCPFWAGIDRFTHEPVRPPVPVMAPEDILAVLSSDPSAPPRAALESADGHRSVAGSSRSAAAVDVREHEGHASRVTSWEINGCRRARRFERRLIDGMCLSTVRIGPGRNAPGLRHRRRDDGGGAARSVDDQRNTVVRTQRRRT